MSREEISKLWQVKTCPCGSPDCSSATIEPHIVRLQGCMDKEVAEHIVYLHNLWVARGEAK